LYQALLLFHEGRHFEAEGFAWLRLLSLMKCGCSANL